MAWVVFQPLLLLLLHQTYAPPRHLLRPDHEEVLEKPPPPPVLPTIPGRQAYAAAPTANTIGKAQIHCILS